MQKERDPVRFRNTEAGGAASVRPGDHQAERSDGGAQAGAQHRGVVQERRRPPVLSAADAGVSGEAGGPEGDPNALSERHGRRSPRAQFRCQKVGLAEAKRSGQDRSPPRVWLLPSAGLADGSAQMDHLAYEPVSANAAPAAAAQPRSLRAFTSRTTSHCSLLAPHTHRRVPAGND